MEEITKKLHLLRQVYLPDETDMDAASEKRLRVVFHLLFLNAIIGCFFTWAAVTGHIPWEVAFFLTAAGLVIVALAVNGLASLTYRRGQLRNFYDEMKVLHGLLKAMQAQTDVFAQLALPAGSQGALLQLQQKLRGTIMILDTLHQRNG